MNINPVDRMNKEAALLLKCDLDEMDMSEVGSGTFYPSGRVDMYRIYETDTQKVTVQYYATSDEVVAGAVYPL